MFEETYTPGSDINETHLLRNNKKLLNILLKDQTTGSNIKWGTDSYISHGDTFNNDQEITSDLITGWYDGFIRPRADKDIGIQLERQRNKAEVFTPSWVVKLQVEAVLDQMNGLSLEEFIKTKWIEITCGEAPYMANRYDMTTGNIIPLNERSGFIDVKFQRLNQEIQDNDNWMKLAIDIYKSSYGYEYQGDSLLLARENLLLTFVDNYFFMFGTFPNNKLILEVSKIVSLNVFQMDGLTYEVPYSSGGNELYVQLSLFDEVEEESDAPTHATIKFWNNGEVIEFKDILKGDVGGMKFDVVIGNPPFQLSTNENNRDEPIYPYFMDQAYQLAKKTVLITPARFLSDAGQTSHSWNKKMLNDSHLKVLFFEQDSWKVFENTDIKGGVAITYYDNDKEFGAIKVFVRNELLKDIAYKVIDQTTFSINTIHHNRSSFRLTDKVYDDFPELKNRTKKSERLSITSNIFDKFSELFSENAPTKVEDYLEVMGRQNNERKIKWIHSKYIQNHPTIGKWKVFLAKSNGTGAIGEALSEPVIANPTMIATQTFITLGQFDSKDEALALNKYIKTKFARAMLSVKKATPDNARKEVWSFVPLQDFTSNSDINWNCYIPDIDRQLYNKYNLSQEEVDYIETNVRGME